MYLSASCFIELFFYFREEMTDLRNFLLVCSALFFKLHNILNLVNSEKRGFSILMHYIFEGVSEGKVGMVS